MNIRLVNLKDINALQFMIMVLVDDWAREKKTPIPLKHLMIQTKKKGVKSFTAVNAINSLLKKGYIRRSCITSNKTYFVQLKRV